MRHSGDVVVWGNCQAGPLASLLTEPLGRAGLTVVPVPPVFLVDAAQLRHVRALLSRAAVLITHPVKDEYATPGCGSAQLASVLPADAKVVRVGSAYHSGAFPYLVNGHGSDGGRVDAPLTTYHDLRLMQTAVRRARVEAAAEVFAEPTAAAGFVSHSAASLAELRRRDREVDVPVADLVHGPGRMFTINHPSNTTLAAVAERILERLGLPARVEIPAREFLGATRAPVLPAVTAALGWPDEPQRHGWTVDSRDLAHEDVTRAHLDFYRRRPDIAHDGVRRFERRWQLLHGRGAQPVTSQGATRRAAPPAGWPR